MAHEIDSAHTSPTAGETATRTSEIDAPHNISVTALSPSEWRVSNAALSEDDPAGLLGFIQLVKTAYEVTNLRLLRERSYFSSFDRAAASLAPQSSSTSSLANRKVLK
ncbi:hypothetical protein GY21_12300 [Cryobacterium roopkundense]|uniref:Uncharacterized protein n=1 Tax=Cryobacterium roopkundense TaxID=1001240 RepID=A0A099J371_9MICO|nr:hypothetical protein [Cryobacterium roopkundense]KGJ72884.1 hypothetical protein GY21_12300 [Cryobacterium roopkundense]MBB5643477.1 hypothetical protein [Cryobacterium roopkundense]